MQAYKEIDIFQIMSRLRDLLGSSLEGELKQIGFTMNDFDKLARSNTMFNGLKQFYNNKKEMRC